MQLHADNIKVMAVENNELVRKGIETALPLIPFVKESFVAKTAEEALQLFHIFKPHVVLVEYALPSMKGDECTRKIKELHPQVKVIGMSHHTETVIVEAMITSGADGFLHKNTTVNEIETAIKTVLTGAYYFFGESANMAADFSLKKLKKIRTIRTELSVREKEIVRLIYKEFTTAEIAEALHMTVPGVESARSRIFKITNAKNTAGVIKYVFKTGLDDYCES
jgi:DNA-binding NarL/FixJ family response regulator